MNIYWNGGNSVAAVEIQVYAVIINPTLFPVYGHVSCAKTTGYS